MTLVVNENVVTVCFHISIHRQSPGNLVRLSVDDNSCVCHVHVGMIKTKCR